MKVPHERSRGRGLACPCPDGEGQTASVGSKEAEDALGSHRASGSSSKHVTSCSVTATQKRSLATVTWATVPFRVALSPVEGGADLPEPSHFTFQSGKVLLNGEKTRERRCLLRRRRNITLRRGFRNYIHLK